MTAKDSANRVLEDLTAAGNTAVWIIANVVLAGCGLIYAGADLQWFGNFGVRANSLYVSNSGPVSNVRFENCGFATTQSCDLSKITRIKSKNTTVKPIIGRINSTRLPNKRYQKLQSPMLPVSSSAYLNPTTFSTAVAATWTSVSEATSTSLTTSVFSTTLLSFDLDNDLLYFYSWSFKV